MTHTLRALTALALTLTLTAATTDANAG